MSYVQINNVKTDLQLFCQQGEVDSVPLDDEALPVSPVHAHLLEGLPERGPGEGLDAGDEPDLVEDAEHALAQLVPHVLLDGGRRQQRVIDGEQEGEERVPGLLLHDLSRKQR